jgi:hypothetical protein
MKKSRRLHAMVGSGDFPDFDMETIQVAMQRFHAVMIEHFNVPPLQHYVDDAGNFDNEKFNAQIAIGMKGSIKRINNTHGLTLTASQIVKDRPVSSLSKAYDDVMTCLDDDKFHSISSFAACNLGCKSVFNVLFVDGVMVRAGLLFYTMLPLAEVIEKGRFSWLDESRYSIESLVAEAMRIYCVICHRRAHQIGVPASSLSDSELEDLLDFSEAALCVAGTLSFLNDDQKLCFVSPQNASKNPSASYQNPLYAQSPPKQNDANTQIVHTLASGAVVGAVQTIPEGPPNLNDAISTQIIQAVANGVVEGVVDGVMQGVAAVASGVAEEAVVKVVEAGCCTIL